MTLVTHPRQGARRGVVRATTWWGRAWIRAVEEAAYGEKDLKAARALARSGRIGSVGTDLGAFAAVVWEGDGISVSGTVPRLDVAGETAVVAAASAVSGRVAALLAGELPLDLVEELDESGAELLPFGGELGWSCACQPWLDPCHHALAVGYQLGWLLDGDPWTLLQLRGLDRDDLLARVHAAASGPSVRPDTLTNEDLALDAARRARRVVGALESDSLDSLEHLL